MRGHFSGFGGSFGLEVLLKRIPAVLGFCNSRRTHVCDDYALITAMSGWMVRTAIILISASLRRGWFAGSLRSSTRCTGGRERARSYLADETLGRCRPGF